MWSIALAVACASLAGAQPPSGPVEARPTLDDGSRYRLVGLGNALPAHHVEHLAFYGQGVDGYNLAVLRGIDTVQARALDGGGYFVGVHADPPESPVGHGLDLLGEAILRPARSTSFCSGATYAVLVEALGEVGRGHALSDATVEALRMTEADGSRREDGVAFWGRWNADGAGSTLALVDHAHAGVVVPHDSARPGDFANISWRSGGGHSVVFLGWTSDAAGRPALRTWSSQPGTHGFGDEVVAWSRVADVQFVRLTRPDRILTLGER